MKWLDFSRVFPPGSHTLFSPSSPAWNNDKTKEDILSRFYRSFLKEIGTAVHEEACDHIIAKTKTSVSEARKSLLRKLVKTRVYVNGRAMKIPRKAYDLDYLAHNFSNYVNDAIDYGLDPEIQLYFSDWNAGTTDAIGYDEKNKILRIHDLKTGTTPAKFTQLENYAALYFLIYGRFNQISPTDTKVELRIYQDGEIHEEYPTAESILSLMDSIIFHSQVVSEAEENDE